LGRSIKCFGSSKLRGEWDNQGENKLTNTYMNYTKIRGESDNQDENKLTNTYMNYKKIRGEWDNQLNRLPLEMHSALNMEDQNSL
jgi:hypothetical protein